MPGHWPIWWHRVTLTTGTAIGELLPCGCGLTVSAEPEWAHAVGLGAIRWSCPAAPRPS